MMRDTVSDKTRIGYMCLTDYEHELGRADGGNKVYPSIENLREHKFCADECGIVEVEVKTRRIVQQPADQMPDEE